tara:strand:+ start:403 stop:645 length:243 start_codon:yes stop_codon:yes gene_type:complete
MNKSELRQLIKEEIQNLISNRNEIKNGDEVLYRDFEEDGWSSSAIYIAYDKSLENSPYYDGPHLIKIGDQIHGTNFVKKI